jgi:hypothetical protein
MPGARGEAPDDGSAEIAETTSLARLALVHRADNVRMAAPDLIVLKRDRDLGGRQYEMWVRRGLFALTCVIPLLALLNVFGQRPSTAHAGGPVAALSVYSPTRVRGGLLFEARFHITARQDIKNAILVLDSGWLEGMSANTIEPSPLGQASANGKLSFTLGHIAAGKSYVLYMEFQVVPTNVGHRSQSVELFDGTHKLLELHRAITVFP